MEKIIRKLQNKLMLLFVTAAPGLCKIGSIFVLNHLYPNVQISYYLNDVFINQILLIFTGISWSSLLLADLNKFSSESQFGFFKEVNFQALIYCIPMIALLYFLKKSGVVIDFFGSLVLLLSSTFYQTFRIYLISIKSIMTLVINEIAIIIFTLVISYTFYVMNFNILIGQAIPFVVIVISVLFSEKKIALFKLNINAALNKRILFNSFTNFTSASIALYFTPLVFQMLNSEQTNLIGMLSYFISILVLFPRAMSYSEIVKMSINVASKES